MASKFNAQAVAKQLAKGRHLVKVTRKTTHPQFLVRDDADKANTTRCLLTLREDSIKVEGIRLDRAFLVSDASFIAATSAAPVNPDAKRQPLEVVTAAEGAKRINALSPPVREKKPPPSKQSGGKPSSALRPSGERARSRKSGAQFVATKVA